MASDNQGEVVDPLMQQAATVEPGRATGECWEATQLHCKQHWKKYSCLGCCIISFLVPSLIFVHAAVQGAVSSRPPMVPFNVLEKLLGKYLNGLPNKYPAAAFASSKASFDRSAIPAEATPYDVCLEPTPSLDLDLPDADDVFDQIFARREFVKEEFGFNLLHCTYVNFFLEDFFRTVRGTNGSYVNRGTGLLSQVYGTSERRTHAMRTYQDGKMKIADDGRLPRWKDVVLEHPELALRCHHLPGYEHNQACLENSTSWFACGDERCNTHPGFIFWSTVFTRHHNYVCNMLAKSHPHMTDEQLFQTARNLNRWSMFKVIWEEYVIKMTCAKDVCFVPFDPKLVHKIGFTRLLKDHPELGFESMPLEFEQLYQWHFWIPDDVWWEDAGKNSTPFVDMMWDPDSFEARSLQDWAEAFRRTPMGHIQPRNYPTWMKQSFTKFLKFSRANHLKSYNDYREFFGMDRYTGWEEFEAGPEVSQALKQLYRGDIERVEFQVGLWADAAKDPIYEKFGLIHPLPKTLKTVVGIFAFTAISNSQMMRNLSFLTAENLKAEGMDYAKALTLETLLENSGIHGLGGSANEVLDSWRPSASTKAMLHGLMGLMRSVR